jgi:hypothetical protein
MRFALRDDDTNFFTSPEALESCYRNIWDILPPTLCLISKVKGNWAHWVHHIYREKQTTDWQAWERDNTVYPIEQNNGLVDFLKEKIKAGKLDVGFHAKYHRNEDDTLPGEVTANYVRGAEVYTNRDLSQDISTEVAHLNELLDYKISVFTPPQNLLSLKGYEAVIRSGLNICGGGISFYKKQKDYRGLINLTKQAVFKLRYSAFDYPYVLHFGNHAEIPYHYPLQPDTELKALIRKFEEVRRFDGDFVLSTHYVEMDYPTTYDPKKSMKNILEEFLSYIGKYKLEYMSLSKLLGS